MVRGRDRDHLRRDRVVPRAVHVRRVGGLEHARPEEERDYAADGRLRLAHSRSAFARRKPKDRNGSAGRPPTSAAFAMTIVIEYMNVVAIHVHPTRRFQRAAAAMKSA